MGCRTVRRTARRTRSRCRAARCIDRAGCPGDGGLRGGRSVVRAVGDVGAGRRGDGPARRRRAGRAWRPGSTCLSRPSGSNRRWRSSVAQWLAGRLLEHQPEQDEVGAAVVVARARVEIRRSDERVERLLRRPDAQRVADDKLLVRRVLEVVVHAAGVAEQFADGDVGGVGIVGQPIGERIVERQLALLDELHDQRGDEGLGHRAHDEGRRRRGRRRWIELGQAVGVAPGAAVGKDDFGGDARDPVWSALLRRACLLTGELPSRPLRDARSRAAVACRRARRASRPASAWAMARWRGARAATEVGRDAARPGAAAAAWCTRVTDACEEQQPRRGA